MDAGMLRQCVLVTMFMATGFSLFVGIVTIMLRANPRLPWWAVSIPIALALVLAGLAVLTEGRR
jgi:hypothetical protein